MKYRKHNVFFVCVLACELYTLLFQTLYVVTIFNERFCSIFIYIAIKINIIFLVLCSYNCVTHATSILSIRIS